MAGRKGRLAVRIFSVNNTLLRTLSEQQQLPDGGFGNESIPTSPMLEVGDAAMSFERAARPLAGVMAPMPRRSNLFRVAAAWAAIPVAQAPQTMLTLASPAPRWTARIDIKHGQVQKGAQPNFEEGICIRIYYAPCEVAFLCVSHMSAFGQA